MVTFFFPPEGIFMSAEGGLSKKDMSANRVLPIVRHKIKAINPIFHKNLVFIFYKGDRSYFLKAKKCWPE